MLLRILPGIFFYGSAITVFYILGRGFFGLGGAITLLTSNGHFIEIIGKPFTATAFFFILSVYFSRKIILSDSLQENLSDSTKLAVTLCIFGFVYEGALLGAIGTAAILVLFRQWDVLRLKRVILGILTAFFGPVFTGFIFQKFYSAHDLSSPTFLSDLVSGDNFVKIFHFLFDSNRFQILNFGTALVFVILGLLFCLRGNSRGLRISFAAFGVGVLITVLFKYFAKDRITHSYVLYLVPLWAALIWDITRNISVRVSEYFLKRGINNGSARFLVPAFIFLVMISITLDEMRTKPMTISNFTEMATPFRRFSENITKDDVLFTSNPALLYGAMSPADKKPYVVRIPFDRKTKKMLPSFRPLPSSLRCEGMCLGRDTSYGHFNPSAPTTWMDVIDQKISEGKRI